MYFSYKKTLKTICLGLILLFPLTTFAELTGEIVFRHPKEYKELWIGNADDGDSGRPIVKLPHDITSFSIQKDGRYIVAVVQLTTEELFECLFDVYIYDRKNPNAEVKRLTQGDYTEILDVDVSPDGDVVFTNHSFIIVKEMRKRGLYLIPNQEIEKKNPIAKLLQEENAYQVDWSPDGKRIVYSTDSGIFLFNNITKQVSFIIKDGDFPVFSPNSKELAFLTRTKPYRLGILSVVGPRNLRYIEPEEGSSVEYLTWSTDGQYLVYTLYNEQDPANTNFAVHIESGQTEQILKTYANGGLPKFEWVSSAYSIDPAELLTTVWGKIKQKK